jgi:hypothetical protein
MKNYTASQNKKVPASEQNGNEDILFSIEMLIL